VVHPQRYLAALWTACESLAQRRAPGSFVHLEKWRVESLEDLQEQGAYTAIVVATGAAAGTLPEVPPQLHDYLDLSQV
jgi:glycine/D-amino acid oxidase-like deaminating enzyme